MAFSKAPRDFYYDKEVKRKSNLPGPQTYNPKSAWSERGFRYHDLTASTIFEDSVRDKNMSRDDIDVHKYESTPLKRNKCSSSMRGNRSTQKSFSMARSNLEMKKNSKIEEEMADKTAKYAELERDFVSLKLSYEKLVSHKQELEDTYTNQNKNNELLKKEIELLKSQLQMKEKELKDAQNRIEDMEREISELINREKTLSENKLTVEQKQLDYIKQLQNDAQKYTTLEVEMTDAENRLLQKTNQLQSAELELYNLKDSKTQIVEILEKMRASYDEQTVVLNGERTTHGNIVTELKNIVSRKDEELEELKAGRSGLTKVLEENTTTNYRYQEMTKELQDELNLRLDELSQKEEELKLLKAGEAKHEQTKREVVDLEEKLTSVQLANEIHNTELQKKEEQISKMESKLGNKSAEVDEAGQKISLITTELENITAEYETKLTVLESSKSILEEKLIEEIQKNEKQTSLIKTLKHAGKHYQDKSESLKRANQDTQSKFDEMKMQHTNNHNDTENIKQQLVDERKKNGEFMKKIQQLTTDMMTQRRDQSMDKVHKETIHKLRSQIDDIEMKLSAANGREEVWRSKFEELERFVTPFRQDLAKYAAEKEHLNGENCRKAQELKDLHVQLAGSMGHQNQRQKIKYVAKLREENQELKEKLSSKECELKKANRQVDALCDDINAMKGIKRFDPKKAFQSVNS